MAIPSATIAAIEAVLQGTGPASERFAAVRTGFPDLSITRCDVSDIDSETPFLETKDFAVYLVDRSSHCWKLTDDQGSATGLVIANRN